VIDVGQYGASGDDAVDDTVAIQAAIAAAQAVPGAKVVLPAGTYYLSDQPPLDQVCLRIDGAHQLSFSGTGEARTHLVLRSERDAHVISLSDCQSVVVSELSIDGTRPGRHDTHGIRVAESSDVVLRALDISRTAHYGIGLQQGALRKIAIEHVRIDDTGGDGIDFKNTLGQNDELTIHDVQVSKPGQLAPRQAGLDIRGRARIWDVRIEQVPEGATGIRFREDGPDTGPGGHDSTLTDFAVQGARGSTGVAIAANGVAVSDGSISGTDTGVTVLGSGATVTRVVARGARYAFRVEAGALGARLDSCRGESSRAGLWLEGQAVQVSGSSFSHNERCGVCIRPGALASQLSGNEFSDNPVAVDDQSATAQAAHE
jgi:hypothetical protein